MITNSKGFFPIDTILWVIAIETPIIVSSKGWTQFWSSLHFEKAMSLIVVNGTTDRMALGYMDSDDRFHRFRIDCTTNVFEEIRNRLDLPNEVVFIRIYVSEVITDGGDCPQWCIDALTAQELHNIAFNYLNATPGYGENSLLLPEERGNTDLIRSVILELKICCLTCLTCGDGDLNIVIGHQPFQPELPELQRCEDLNPLLESMHEQCNKRRQQVLILETKIIPLTLLMVAIMLLLLTGFFWQIPTHLESSKIKTSYYIFHFPILFSLVVKIKLQGTSKLQATKLLSKGSLKFKPWCWPLSTIIPL